MFSDSRLLYTGLVGLVVLARFAELARARRNAAWLRARGAVESGEGHYPWMVRLHSAFVVACVAEVWLLDRPFVPALAAVALALFVAATLVRYWVIATLGRRWTTRILCLPGEPLVTSGPYRLLRHPNYLAVAVELAALPLIHGAWLTALVFGVLNAWLLRVRIAAEEAALRRAAAEPRPDPGSQQGRAAPGRRAGR